MFVHRHHRRWWYFVGMIRRLRHLMNYREPSVPVSETPTETEDDEALNQLRGELNGVNVLEKELIAEREARRELSLIHI